MEISTTTAITAEAPPEMVNENRNMLNSRNINNQNLNDGSVSELIEDVVIVTNQYFLCRICYNYDQIQRFISPCLCKGSLFYVHRNCLEHWLSRAGILHCELCMYRFRTECTLRYSFCEAMRLWYRHPNNRGLIQSDAMLCSTLTLIVFGLLAIACFGLEYFIPKGRENGFSEHWMKGTTFVLLVVSILAYIVYTIFMIRQQICPFYRWWRSSRIVRVILPKTI